MARLFDDGSSEYLEIDSSPISGVVLTMACWFYSDTIGLEQVLIYLGNPGSHGHYFALEANGGDAGDPIWATSRSGGEVHAESTAGYSTFTWHHAAGVWSAADARAAFLDGGNKGTNTTSNSPTGLARTCIGRMGDSSPSDYMSGRIAEAAIWDAALTDGEVAILALGYSPLLVRPQSLVFYAPLIRDEDRDVVGGLSLTAFNTPSIATHTRVLYPSMKQLGHYSVSAPAIRIPRYGFTNFQVPGIV